jgi:hypothetical protein
MKRKLSLVIMAIVLSGCTSKPYAIIDGSKSKRADQYSSDVVITGIDGQMIFDGRKIRNLEPGSHYVQLTSVKTDRQGRESYRPWAFNAEACKRYVVAAKHDPKKKFSSRYWEVELLRVEPIKGCEVKPQEKAPANSAK